MGAGQLCTPGSWRVQGGQRLLWTRLTMRPSRPAWPSAIALRRRSRSTRPLRSPPPALSCCSTPTTEYFVLSLSLKVAAHPTTAAPTAPPRRPSPGASVPQGENFNKWCSTNPSKEGGAETVATAAENSSCTSNGQGGVCEEGDGSRRNSPADVLCYRAAWLSHEAPDADRGGQTREWTPP